MEFLPKQPSVKAPAETFTGEVTVIHPGDTIWTPPGEWHWHGAAPDHFMTHLAIWEAPGEGQGAETEWGDLITDAEYSAPGVSGQIRTREG